jgi:hypothetical protein
MEHSVYDGRMMSELMNLKGCGRDCGILFPFTGIFSSQDKIASNIKMTDE